MTVHLYSTHTLSVLAYNRPGILAKVTSLFTRRGFNIESISAGKAKNEEMLRLTIVVRADEKSLEQIQKQLNKLIDTVKVSLIQPEFKVERELALIKVKSPAGVRPELFQLIEVYRGRIVDASPSGIVIEITGTVSKIDAFVNMLSANSIIEIARTGTAAVNRWPAKKTNATGKENFYGSHFL